MDKRKAQGRAIARAGFISKRGPFWLVPSQTRPGVTYKVVLDGENSQCNCPDFAANGKLCKHGHAARVFHTKYPDAELVDPKPRKRAPNKRKRQTYSQDWPKYNEAQTNEREHVMTMLKGLTEYIVDDEKPKRGRPPIPKSDLVFQMIQKVYEGRSARRFIGDVRETFRSGRIGKVPHFNSIINGMKDAEMTPILHGLIEISSRPLRELPGDFVFAADSSGFSASPHYRWLENKPGAVKQREGEDAEQFEIRTRRVWTKVHLMCSTRTHVVTGVVIKNRDASDVQQLKALIEQTDPNFNIQELCADKAYGAIYNYQQCADLGIDPYIPFKTNQNGSAASRTGSKWNTAGGRLWNNCFHRFHLHVEEFEQHYHQRSNVESVFSMIKRKFGPSVFSKSETGMINEVLCKIILHNIWCVIEAMYTLGIDPSELEPTRPPKPRLQVIQGGLQ